LKLTQKAIGMGGLPKQLDEFAQSVTTEPIIPGCKTVNGKRNCLKKGTHAGNLVIGGSEF